MAKTKTFEELKLEYESKEYIVRNGEKLKPVRNPKFPGLNGDINSKRGELMFRHPDDPVVEQGLDTSIEFMLLRASRGDIQIGKYKPVFDSNNETNEKDLDKLFDYPDPRPADSADAQYQLSRAKIKYALQQKQINDLKARKKALDAQLEAEKEKIVRANTAETSVGQPDSENKIA